MSRASRRMSSRAPAPPTPELIAISSSLGGLHALEKLLSPLPATLPAAIAIVQHRGEDADTRLAQLLAKRTHLPVKEPDDKDDIEPGTVYLAPAGYHLMVEEASFALSVDPPVCFARPSADVLFESVADAFGPRSVGVVLTSSSEDGAAGALAIHRAGGRVAVQDPNTAEADVAPRAAITLAKPHYIGDTLGIAKQLVEWCGAEK